MHCERKARERDVKLGASHVLTLVEKKELGVEFLAEFKATVQKHNEELKERLAALALHKGGVLKQTSGLLSTWKAEAKALHSSVLIRTGACKFIMGYKSPFAVVENASTCDVVFERQGDAEFGESVDDFVKVYEKKEIWKIIVTGKEHNGLLKVYNKYMKKVKEDIAQSHSSFTYEEVQKLYKEVEAYISMRLHNKLFSRSPSERDKDFFRRTLSLSWIKPSQLEIDEQLLEYDFWQAAVSGTTFPQPRAAAHGSV